MNINQLAMYELYYKLYTKLKNGQFVQDKSGVKLVQELTVLLQFDPKLGHHLKVVNPKTGWVFKQTDEQYVKLQTSWHESMQLNVNMVDHVKIWHQVSGENGQINSNYGWCVFHPDNGSEGKSQFQHVVQTLKRHRESRQALIIYTRPTMHTDSKRNGMSDFLCTIANQFLIRDGKLNMVYLMKGTDMVYGIFHNYPWSCYVYNKMYQALKPFFPQLQFGWIRFFTGSAHIYERHFKKLEKLFKKQNQEI